MKRPALDDSRALWNRTGFRAESDEDLAQILDRGEMDSWRALYGLARDDAALRRRIHRLVLTVPVALPRFWLAALASLGEDVDIGVELPDYWERTSI
jgi:hypothetical protein